MTSRIKDFFMKRYFGSHLPFEYRLFMIFFMEALILSILSATTNTLLGKGIGGVIFQWSFIAFMIFLLSASVNLRMVTSRPLLLFASFVYIPYLFFQTAGYDGTAGLFALVAVFLMTVLFKGRIRIVIVISNIIEWVTICFINFNHPEMVIGHGGEQAKFIDYVVAIILTLSGVAILGIYYRTQFNIEKQQITELNSKLEESNKILKNMAVRDPLTGAYNRRYIANYLTETLEKSGDEKKDSLFLMMLDLDRFKLVNDTYGHHTGDSVLTRFTSVVQGIIKESDTLARLGGEEFLVVMYGSAMSEAKNMAEKIRCSASDMTFPEGVHVTVSIGVVEAHEGDSYDTIFSRADNCMYQAKSRGRNCVVTEDNLNDM